MSSTSAHTHELASVSAVICSFRRLDMLRDTLISLRSVHPIDGIACEIVVVDNDPEQGAAPLVARLQQGWAAHSTLRYLHEPQTGLSHARNCGIENTAGDIIAFLDDDILVEADWLQQLVHCFVTTGAECVGGRAPVCWEDEPDPSVRACQDHLASFDLGDTDHEILGPAQPIGANLAFRRRVFADGLRFATNLGRIGGLLLSGEDTELVEAIRIRGGRVWYCASAVVHHRIGGNRLTRKFYVQRHYWFGVSRSVMDRARGGLTYQLTRALGGALFLPVVHIPAWLWASVTGDAGGRLMSTCALSKLVGYWRGLTVATAPLPESQQRVRRAHPKPASPAIAVAASGRGQP